MLAKLTPSKKNLFALLLDQQSAQTVNVQNADACTFPAQNSVVLKTADDAGHGFPVRADPRGEIHEQRRR